MDFALRLFRQAFEHVVRKGVLPPLPPALPPELARPESGVYAAAFEKPGRRPRGRVGSYLPMKPTLAEDIQAQAVALAVTFPFRKGDLPFLTYELFLTRSPHFLADLDDLHAEAGLLVRTHRGPQGVSLPGAKERSPAERLTDACVMAGIDPRREDIRLYEFAIEALREDQ